MIRRIEESNIFQDGYSLRVGGQPGFFYLSQKLLVKG